MKRKLSKFMEEFKKFVLRGNVLDLAVGVIVGGAFQSLVSSLTNNIISPILGCFSEVDFSSFKLTIGRLTITYGAFITDVINFIIMAFIVFLIVKFMNKLFEIGNKKEEKEKKEEEEKISKEEELLTEIRDLLKKQNNKEKTSNKKK